MTRKALAGLTAFALVTSSAFSFIGAFPLTASADAGCDPSVQLIANGGFESPVVTNSDKWDIFPNGTTGLAWNVDWLSTDATTYNGHTRPATAVLELQKSGHLGWLPAEGQQYAELDTDWQGPGIYPTLSAPASVIISQDVPTVAGNTYTLSFDFSPRPDTSGSNENVLNVGWNGSQVASLTAAGSGNAAAQTQWTSHTYTLTATSSTSTITFADGGIPDSVGTFLDNVSLVCATGGNGGTNPGNGGTNPGNGGTTGTSTSGTGGNTGTSTNSTGGNTGTSTNSTGGTGGTTGTSTTGTSTSTTSTSTLTVIDTVTNTNGGTSTPDDFVLSVTGLNVSTSTFNGSATGTVVTLDPGAYSVTQSSSSDYATSYSSDCSGVMATSTSLTCTISNSDIASSTGSGSGTGTTTSTSTTTTGTGTTSGTGSTGGSGSGGGGSGVAPLTAYSTPSPSEGGGSTGGSTGPITGSGTGTGTSAPIGQVLGASTGPGMPTTGGSGNADVTYVLAFAVLALVSESAIAIIRKRA